MERCFQNQRQSIRLENHDYSSPGAYFVTICTNIKGFDWFGVLSREGIVLNAAGQMVKTELHNLPKRFPNLELDTYIIMPDHIHAILMLSDLPDANAQGRGELHVRPASQPKQQPLTQIESPIPQSVTGERTVRPYDHPNGTKEDSVSRMVQLFKTFTTREYIRGVRELGWQAFEKRFWQRDYFEHIIEFAEELENTCNYILENPIRAIIKKGLT